MSIHLRSRPARGRTPAASAPFSARRVASGALLVAALACGVAATASAASKTPTVAPAFNLPAASGTVSLEALKGKVVLVDFWASWCGPCTKSFPWIASLGDRFDEEKFTVVAVNLDKDRKAADAFLRQHPLPFQVAFDPAGDVARAFGVSAMPMSFLIAGDGTILVSHKGFDEKGAAELEAAIGKAVGQ